MINQVPAHDHWLQKDEYRQVLSGRHKRHFSGDYHYWLNPRLGAFEISTVIDNTYILFYSKLLSRQWPRYDLLAKRIGQCFVDSNEGMTGPELKAKYEHKVII
mmetsp:Transcript_14878/g.20142  ORF Transcript_14878/g.20142 Transcript_14878/m.20142 type:complete len:103 (-) Transcript_14878:770-1078(-)